jgi:hypothetical protein
VGWESVAVKTIRPGSVPILPALAPGVKWSPSAGLDTSAARMVRPEFVVADAILGKS